LFAAAALLQAANFFRVHARFRVVRRRLLEAG
jgi:hypothetical protein